MRKKLLLALAMAFTPVAYSAEITGTAGDWEYVVDTGIGSRYRGALAHTKSGDVDVGFSCYTESSTAWLTLQFYGDIENHKDKSYFMQLRTSLFNTTWEGYAYEVDDEIVQIEATSYNNNEIDRVIALIGKLDQPFELLVAEFDPSAPAGPTGARPIGETFRYTVSHNGAETALNAIREGCGHRAFTGYHEKTNK